MTSSAVERRLPADDQLRQRVMDYFDWGPRIALDVSQDPAGTDLGDPGPTPRWGWENNPQ